MRGVRIREALLLVALVALGLGWGADHVRMARSLAEAERRGAISRLEAAAQAARAIAARDRDKLIIDGLRRRLAECEG